MSELALGDHPFLTGLDPAHVETLSSCLIGRASWGPGEAVLNRGEMAETCHLLIRGTVAVEIRVPGRAPRTIQTLHDGELLGWSWLFEPYIWTFTARAVEESTAFTFDATRLLKAIEDDSEFGVVILRRVAKAIVDRLKSTRLQVLDVYNR